jgi:hypothetical protein
LAIALHFYPSVWFRTPDATPSAGELRLTLRFFIEKFAPVVSAYSLQGLFCVLKSQTRKWKILTAKITKVETKPQNQPQNDNAVELVHILQAFFRFFVVKRKRAHLHIPMECQTLKTYRPYSVDGVAELSLRGLS